jgi:hypothetical protein
MFFPLLLSCMVKERTQTTDATARLETRALVHRERRMDGCARGSGFEDRVEKRPFNDRGNELCGLLFGIEHVEGEIMVLLVAAKASRTLSSSSVGLQCVLLSYCLDRILELLFCAACLQLMVPQ